jgi:hypothetical protein
MLDYSLTIFNVNILFKEIFIIYFNMNSNNLIQNEEIIDISHIKDNNVKRMLCYKTLIGKTCHYGKKCMYAHELDHQQIDNDRKHAYEIIINKHRLDNINLSEDATLFNTLKQLTKVCEYCMKGFCPGGYNCKHGVFKREYQVCFDDIMGGNCTHMSCSKIHLTKRGLIPNNRYKLVKNNNVKSIFIKKKPKNYTLNKDELEGILLTSSYFSINDNMLTDSDSESESEEEINRKISYLNSEDDNESENESIFMV